MTDYAKEIKTIFCDIDGVIFKHCGDLTITYDQGGKLLLGVTDKFKEWAFKGYKIILITGRPESMREFTKKQLENAGLFYDQLIMGLPRGERVVINDRKPNSHIPTTKAIDLERNKGLENVDI